MPVDIRARVIGNALLSPDYNVLSLAAPEIAATCQPGQFVMVKPRHGTDPLLRRPFSVFEVLRDSAGTPTGITILSKRIGVTTRLLHDAAEGDTIVCLGPRGRPFTLVEPPAEAWRVAGGVGLAVVVLLSVWPLLRWKFPEWLAEQPAVAWLLLGLIWWPCLTPSWLGLVWLGLAVFYAARHILRTATPPTDASDGHDLSQAALT